jgi:hypothetical protein
MGWVLLVLALFSIEYGFRMRSLMKDVRARHEELLARFDRLEAQLGAQE